MNANPQSQLQSAFLADDVARVEEFLRAEPKLIDLCKPTSAYETPVLARCRSVAMAQLLCDSGADPKSVESWWSSGLFVNPQMDPTVGRFLIERGAQPTVHTLAALGLTDLLKPVLQADPNAVRAKGGDGCTPLHFARTVETAELLLEAGADLNARDEDHESSPAHWLIGHSPAVAEYLLKRGATPDLFLAAALGDLPLAKSLVEADRSRLRQWIGKSPWHPIGHHGRGGTILQWTLGFNCFPHQTAARRQHTELFDNLMSESDTQTKFLVACVMANRPLALKIASEHPTLVANLPVVDLELLARYCWETNVDIDAVRLMLDVGFPIDRPENSHGYTPLHNAAWGGYADLVDLLIARGHPVDIIDPRYKATPLQYAFHCCLQEKRHPEGQYPRVAASLLNAGSPWNQSIYPTGNASLDEVLKKHLSAAN